MLKKNVNLFLIVFKENYNTIEKSEKIEKKISICKVCLLNTLKKRERLLFKTTKMLFDILLFI